MKRLLSTIAIAAAAALTFTGCSAAGPSAAGGEQRNSASVAGDPVRVAMVTHGVPNDPFWNVIRKGAEDAAEDFNVELDYQDLQQGAADPGQEARLLEGILATDTQGIAVTIPDATALGDPIKKALDKGLPVVGFNSGESDYKSLGVSTYVGFSEATTGETAGQAMLDHGAKNILCVNHQQGNLLLERICKALISVVTSQGGSASELVVDGTNPSGVQADIKAALDQDASVDGLYALGPQVHDAVRQGIDDAKKSDQFVFGQLNMTGILPDVINGKTDFTIDLEPYLEGYLAVQTIAQDVRLGIRPLGLVSTGPLLVTKENAEQALELSEKNIR